MTEMDKEVRTFSVCLRSEGTERGKSSTHVDLLSSDDLKKYETVKKKIDDYFVQQRNVIFERAKFNQRRQEENEAVDDFIVDLYCLAEHGGYGKLHDEMIRDRIAVGVRDRKLLEKLQLEKNLTLETVVTEAHQSQTIKSNKPS